MIKQGICVSLSVLLWTCAGSSQAEIYRYVDEQGLIHFSDRPLDEPNLRPKPIPRHVSLNNQPKKTTSTQFKIYKYTDPYGVVHLTDSPPDGNYKLIYVSKNLSLPSMDGVGRDYRPSASLRERAATYSPLIEAAAKRNKLDPALLHAVITAESAYNPDALSPKGAAGLMQLMPATAKSYGVTDRYDPADNIAGGSSYLRDLMKRFNNDMELAVAAYNAGEGAVIRYGHKIPPYKETQYYVTKVLSLYESYQ